MSRSNTSFAVLPALIPDIEGVYDAYFAAFEADQDGKRVLDLLFPDGYTSKEFREAHKKATIDWWHHSTEQYTFKCIDLNTLEVVGMALIDVFARQRSDDPETRKFTGIPWLSGEHRERADAVVGALCEAREKIWGGKPYIYVHAIAVSPKHQGRGAGAAIVADLVNMSNQSRLPIYLESLPGSERLYLKAGFQYIPKETASVTHKAALLGTDKDVEVPLMVRYPDAPKV